MVSVCLGLVSGILTEDVIIEVTVLGDGGMSGCKSNLHTLVLLTFHAHKPGHTQLEVHLEV